jgi:NAD(P)-dependent dehydrogenase (short-subunit alcohol dehydrogenase family)
MSRTRSTDSSLVVITGATRGLGRAMVDGFARAGWKVAGCARSRDGIAALRALHPAPHDFDVVNVADDRAVTAWAERLITTCGPPDLLLNNAALINANAPLWEVPADEFARVMDVNITGTFHVLRAFLPAICRRKRGVIVNFSSGWGRSTAPEVAPYCATKWAIEGLTQALAQELPDGVAAVALNPGIIDTDMLRSCWASGASQFPQAEAWARVAVPYLLSLSAADNGRSLTVPGADE